jgi:ornithine decarboxylase
MEENPPMNKTDIPEDESRNETQSYNAFRVATEIRPSLPTTLVYPEETARAAKIFVTSFQGTTMYAVKANPSEELLRILWEQGVRWFDVASIGEVRWVSKILPRANLCFMHPVKTKEAIKEAYFSYGVRTFCLDDKGEFDKVLKATSTKLGPASDLTLFVRIQVHSQHAMHSLSSKFGVSSDEAPSLLKSLSTFTKRFGGKVGICFHVGSQVMALGDYASAIRQAKIIQQNAGVPLNYLDIGGGFGVKYPTITPPRLEQYLKEIHTTFRELSFQSGTELVAEPGRFLSVWHNSMALRVEKKVEIPVEGGFESYLYLRDGPYGTLSDARYLKWPYFARSLRTPPSREKPQNFMAFGPTCDSLDRWGPISLPADTSEGDYIEIFGLGAYGVALRTSFNGCDNYETFTVRDRPIDSIIEEITGIGSK